MSTPGRLRIIFQVALLGAGCKSCVNFGNINIRSFSLCVGLALGYGTMKGLSIC